MEHAVLEFIGLSVLSKFQLSNLEGQELVGEEHLQDPRGLAARLGHIKLFDSLRTPERMEEAATELAKLLCGLQGKADDAWKALAPSWDSADPKTRPADAAAAQDSILEVAHDWANKGVLAAALQRSKAHAKLQAAGSLTNSAGEYEQINQQTLAGSIVGSAGPAITGIAEMVRQRVALGQEVEASLLELQHASEVVAEQLGDTYTQLVADAWASTWRLLGELSGVQGGAAIEQLLGVWASVVGELPEGDAPAADLDSLQQLFASESQPGSTPAEQLQYAQVLGTMLLLRKHAVSAQQQLEALCREPQPGVLVDAGQGRVKQQLTNAAEGSSNARQHQADGGRRRVSLKLEMGSSRLLQMLLDRAAADSNSIFQHALRKLRADSEVRPTRARAADTSGSSPAQLFDDEGVGVVQELLEVWEEHAVLAAEKVLREEGMYDLLTSSALPGGWEWACSVLGASMLLDALEVVDHSLWVGGFERALAYSRRRPGAALEAIGYSGWLPRGFKFSRGKLYDPSGAEVSVKVAQEALSKQCAEAGRSALVSRALNALFGDGVTESRRAELLKGSRLDQGFAKQLRACGDKAAAQRLLKELQQRDAGGHAAALSALESLAGSLNGAQGGKPSASRFKGVRKHGKKWQAHLVNNYTAYDTQEQAAHAFDLTMLWLLGKGLAQVDPDSLNFPLSGYDIPSIQAEPTAKAAVLA